MNQDVKPNLQHPIEQFKPRKALLHRIRVVGVPLLLLVPQMKARGNKINNNVSTPAVSHHHHSPHKPDAMTASQAFPPPACSL